MIKLQSISKVYELHSQRVEALKSIDLEIPAGSMVAITGKSGAGKSTFLHVCGTLERTTTGHLYYDNTEVSALSDKNISKFRNQKIGFVFQGFNLLADFSAVENVMMPGLISGAVSSQVKSRAEVLLQAVGLSERIHHKPSELSGGEQQRVAIARSLIMAPRVIFADEPTGNLDEKTSHLIRDLLIQVCRENKVTLLLVTHDRDLAKNFPGQMVMQDGCVIEQRGF